MIWWFSRGKKRHFRGPPILNFIGDYISNSNFGNETVTTGMWHDLSLVVGVFLVNFLERVKNKILFVISCHLTSRSF